MAAENTKDVLKIAHISADVTHFTFPQFRFVSFSIVT